MNPTTTVTLKVDERASNAAICRDEFARLLHATFGLDCLDSVTACDRPNVILTTDGTPSGANVHDSFSITLDEGHLDIHANTDIALLIAVYRFFHEFGVRYTRPGRACETIPSLDASDSFKARCRSIRRPVMSTVGYASKARTASTIFSTSSTGCPK